MTFQHNHDWPLVFTNSSLLITCLNIYNFIAPMYSEGFLMRLGENYTWSAYIGYIMIHTICCLDNRYTDWIFILLIYLFHLHIFKGFNETNQQFCEYEKMHMVEKHIIMRDSPRPPGILHVVWISSLIHPVHITANVVSSIIIPCPGILDEIDQWFSSDTLVSFTNKSECDYTTEILFKVSINVICIHLYTANI